jgi:hypothetical protein
LINRASCTAAGAIAPLLQTSRSHFGLHLDI